MTGRAGLSGIILAGGAARRMGADKALLTADGRRLVDHAVAALTAIVDDVVCARGQRAPLGLAGVREVADAVPQAGPLAGLAAGLAAARHELAVVLAVDLLAPNPELLRRLVELRTDEDAVVPIAAGRLQPLHAVWARTALPCLRRRLDAGQRSLHGALAQLHVTVAGPEVWGDLDDGSFARDADAPGDLPGPRPAPGPGATSR